MCGVVFALAAPAITFYTVTRVQLAQQEIRMTNAERRLDKLDDLVKEEIRQIHDKLDALSEIKTSIARLDEQVKGLRSDRK